MVYTIRYRDGEEDRLSFNSPEEAAEYAESQNNLNTDGSNDDIVSVFDNSGTRAFVME